MKTYKKRIAFCLSDQHTIPHGGLGQFAKSFVESFTPLGYKIDIITDKPVSNLGFKTYLEEAGARFICASEHTSYAAHSKIFMFDDSLNFEKMINFRNSLMLAFSENLYDIVVCNTLESFPAMYALNLHRSIQVIYYTHNESMVFLDDRTWKNEFTESFNETFNVLMNVKGITVGTQTERNLAELKTQKIENAKHLPIPMTEQSLLKQHFKPREGVLWIGRWEPRKNPEEFIRVIKETKLPAKVITNANGAKKFEAALTEIGATFEIKVGVYGEEKVDFLTSARIAYNPAIRESFGLAFYETMGHMPTVAIEGMSWLYNFDENDYIAAPKNQISELILDLYEQYQEPGYWYDNDQNTFGHIVEMNAKGIQSWIKTFNEFKPAESNSNKARINEHDQIKYADYIRSLNRKDLAMDDVRSVLTNRYKYNIIYTDTSTYLSKDPNFIPTEEAEGLEALFE